MVKHRVLSFFLAVAIGVLMIQWLSVFGGEFGTGVSGAIADQHRNMLIISGVVGLVYSLTISWKYDVSIPEGFLGGVGWMLAVIISLTFSIAVRASALRSEPQSDLGFSLLKFDIFVTVFGALLFASICSVVSTLASMLGIGIRKRVIKPQS